MKKNIPQKWKRIYNKNEKEYTTKMKKNIKQKWKKDYTTKMKKNIQQKWKIINNKNEK